MSLGAAMTLSRASEVRNNDDYPVEKTNIVFLVESLCEEYNYSLRVQDDAGEMGIAAFFYQLRKDNAMVGGRVISGRKLEKQRGIETTKILHDAFEFRRLWGSGMYFYRAKGEYLFNAISAEKMKVAIKSIYQSLFDVSDGGEVDKAVKTFENSIKTQHMIDRIDKRYVAIGESLLVFDREEQKLLSAKELAVNGDTFDVPEYPPVYLQLLQGQNISAEDGEKIRDIQSTILRKLNGLKGDGTDVAMEIDSVKDWACGDPEIYWNIMHMYSAPFHKKLPPFSYILSGVTRNGKSASIELFKRLVSSSNASAIGIDGLGDWHNRDNLAHPIINCPTEVDTQSLIKGQSFYKQSSSHEDIVFQTMGGQESISMPTNYINIFPVNSIPKWEGSGAQASVKRTFLIPFDADFEAVDDENYSYEEEHYTHDFMVKFTAHVLAFAEYFSTHKFVRNSAFLRGRALMSASADPLSVFIDEFNKVFSGFQSLAMFRREAENFFVKNGFSRSEIPEIKKTSDIRLSMYRETKLVNPADGKRYRCYIYKDANPNALPVMFNNYQENKERTEILGGKIIPTSGTPIGKTFLDDFLDRGESYVYIFRELRELRSDSMDKLENGASSSKIASNYNKQQRLLANE